MDSEGSTMVEAERERQEKRGADLHQRGWICMRESMLLFRCLHQKQTAPTNSWCFVVFPLFQFHRFLNYISDDITTTHCVR